jgi:hypothetical protein
MLKRHLWRARHTIGYFTVVILKRLGLLIDSATRNRQAAGQYSAVIQGTTITSRIYSLRAKHQTTCSFGNTLATRGTPKKVV